MIVPVVSTTFASFEGQFRGSKAARSAGSSSMKPAKPCRKPPWRAVAGASRHGTATPQIEPVFTLPSRCHRPSAPPLRRRGWESADRASVQSWPTPQPLGATGLGRGGGRAWVGCRSGTSSLRRSDVQPGQPSPIRIDGLWPKRAGRPAPRPFYGIAPGSISGRVPEADRCRQTVFSPRLLTATYRRVGALPASISFRRSRRSRTV